MKIFNCVASHRNVENDKEGGGTWHVARFIYKQQMWWGCWVRLPALIGQFGRCGAQVWRVWFRQVVVTAGPEVITEVTIVGTWVMTVIRVIVVMAG